MANLNLCSGPFPIQGCTNVDIHKYDRTDVVCDARYLPFKNDSFKYIFFIHAIEHFTYDEAMDILKNLKRVLSSRGVLHIEGPDIIKTALHYHNHNRIAEFMFGSLDEIRRNPLYTHKWGYTGSKVWQELKNLGFEVSEVNPGPAHGLPDRDYKVIGVKQ